MWVWIFQLAENLRIKLNALVLTGGAPFEEDCP